MIFSTASDIEVPSGVASGVSASVTLLKAAPESEMFLLVDAILKKRFTRDAKSIKIDGGWVFDDFDTLFIRYFYEP